MSRIGDLSDSATRPTAAPSPGTEACAFERMVCWSKIVPAAFCATATSAVSPCPDSIRLRATFMSEHEGRTAAVVQVEHPIRFHAKAMRHPAAAAVERHVRQLNMGDQDVDVLDGVLAVAFDDARGRPFHHVDGRLVLATWWRNFGALNITFSRSSSDSAKPA